MKKFLFINVILIGLIKPIFTQEKKTPDSFNGFRNFEFYEPITNYYNYDYTLVENFNNTSIYEIILPYKENQFLETQINKILIEQYKNQICEITLILKEDIGSILKNMIKDSYSNENESFENISLSKYSLIHSNSKRKIEDYYEEKQTIFDQNSKEIDFMRYDTVKNELDLFRGHNTILYYGDISIAKVYKKTVKEPDNPYMAFETCKIIQARETLFNGFFLTFEAVDFKENIDSKQVKEHYDTYLSDFGTEHYPKENENKASYKIPLFESNNIYYVRALFGDIVENLVFDTGADQLIIGKTLYEKLKNKKLVTDQNSTLKMVMANGTTAELKKVMISNLQLYDLKVDYIEAYVNTAAEISLLGQSFLKRFGGISVDYKTNVLTIKK